MTYEQSFYFKLNRPTEILKRFWGYDSFREGQAEIIESVLEGNDVLALLPTGGGKSICYQVPGLVSEGVCIVVSPLIALMLDQVQQLKQRKIKAEAIHSGLSKREIDIILDNAVYGNTKFLYLSPERLKSRLFRARFEKMNVSFIAVDEAHCISQWGYDFRPAYLNISELRETKPDIPIMALTATATPEVVDDIMEKLKLKDSKVVQNSFVRENLSYNLHLCDNKLNRLNEMLTGNKESGIIYCNTRKAVKTLCKHLVEQGVSAHFYHGGLSFDERQERQSKWINNQYRFMVCTNAFGMGIDKADVRNVFHFEIPDTLESYFQEAGRAGRDGNNASTHLLFEKKDKQDFLERLSQKFPPLEFIKSVYNALGNHFQLAYGSGKDEKFDFDLLDFCSKYEFELIPSFNALNILEIAGFIETGENLTKSSKIKIETTKENLYQFQVRSAQLNNIIQFILRTNIGVFDEFKAFDERKCASILKVPEKEIISAINYLQQHEVLSYIPSGSKNYIVFTTERLDNNRLTIPAEVYSQRKAIAEQKANAMMNFLESPLCNSRKLLAYFGEIDSEDCGICSSCKRIKVEANNTDLQSIIHYYINNLFESKEEISLKDLIADHSSVPRDLILETIGKLKEHNQLDYDPINQMIRRV